MSAIREIYVSTNGDKWHLVRDPITGRSVVRHTANASSGGHVEDISLPAFLGAGRESPEHQALWRLIGTLDDIGEYAPQTVVALVFERIRLPP